MRNRASLKRGRSRGSFKDLEGFLKKPQNGGPAKEGLVSGQKKGSGGEESCLCRGILKTTYRDRRKTSLRNTAKRAVPVKERAAPGRRRSSNLSERASEFGGDASLMQSPSFYCITTTRASIRQSPKREGY